MPQVENRFVPIRSILHIQEIRYKVETLPSKAEMFTVRYEMLPGDPRLS